MGTKHCPETPRQKMINMMYLVLTAMLALNVAAETLQAFKVVDKSLMKTYLTFTDKNKTLLTDFRQQYELNSAKVEKWMVLANEVSAHSDSLVNFLIDTKEKLARAAGGEDILPEDEVSDEFPIIVTKNQDSILLKRQDDLNVSPMVMITQKRGEELQNRVKEFHDYLSSLVSDSIIIENMKSSLDVSDPEKEKLSLNDENYRTWVEQNFLATPVIASITLLSKLQIDVRNAESAVLRYLYNQIDAASFKFTGLKATVIPDASYIFQGQQYKARIFLSAEDSTQKLNVYVNGSQTPLKLDGNEAIYSTTPSAPGEYSYNGVIRFRTPGGGPDDYSEMPFTGDYQVAVPTATVSATAMNVLFKSLKNPIAISVPGVPSNKIRPVCTNGSIVKEGDHWVVEPENLDFSGDNTKIQVFAEVDGQQRLMREEKYRVMKVPNPIATVAGIASGNIAREKLRTTRMVSATLLDFYYDLKFEVVSFDMLVPSGGGMSQTLSSNTYNFTDEQKQMLSLLGNGDKLIIENIKARIQGDQKDDLRQLPSIILTVQ